MCVCVKDTGSHELLDAAGWQRGVLRSDQVEVEPVGHLDVGAQLYGVILIFVGNVDKKATVKQSLSRKMIYSIMWCFIKNCLT